MKFTEEQEETLKLLDNCNHYYMCAFRTLIFLERELGKVHKITVEYRKGIYKEAQEKMRDAQKKTDECGLIDELFRRLKQKYK